MSRLQRDPRFLLPGDGEPAPQAPRTPAVVAPEVQPLILPPLVANLPSFLGLGWLDGRSVTKEGGVVRADYTYGEELVYRVEWSARRCSLEEYEGGARIGETSERDLRRAALAHGTASVSNGISLLWARLARRVRGLASVQVSGDDQILAAVYPALDFAAVHFVDAVDVPDPVITLPRHPGVPDGPVSQPTPHLTLSRLVRRWADGRQTVDSALGLSYEVPLIFVEPTLWAVAAAGHRWQGKEYRPYVVPFLANRVPDIRVFLGDAARGLSAFAIARARTKEDLDLATDAAQEQLRRWELPEVVEGDVDELTVWVRDPSKLLRRT